MSQPNRPNPRNKAGLTKAQADFVRDFTTNPTALQGRNGRHGVKQMLANPNVQMVLAKRLVGAENLSPHDIIGNILRISDKAEEAGMFMASLKAQELLGKWKGMWIEKHVNLNVDLAKSHVDALVERMRARKAEALPNLAGEVLHLTSNVSDPFDGV